MEDSSRVDPDAFDRDDEMESALFHCGVWGMRYSVAKSHFRIGQRASALTGDVLAIKKPKKKALFAMYCLWEESVGLWEVSNLDTCKWCELAQCAACQKFKIQMTLDTANVWYSTQPLCSNMFLISLLMLALTHLLFLLFFPSVPVRLSQSISCSARVGFGERQVGVNWNRRRLQRFDAVKLSF